MGSEGRKVRREGEGARSGTGTGMGDRVLCYNWERACVCVQGLGLGEENGACKTQETPFRGMLSWSVPRTTDQCASTGITPEDGTRMGGKRWRLVV